MIPVLLIVIIIDEYFKKFCNNVNFIINNINEEFINDLYNKCKNLIEFIEKENLKSVENITPLINKNELNNIIKINDFEKNRQIFTFILEKKIKFPNISKNDLIKLIKKLSIKIKIFIIKIFLAILICHNKYIKNYLNKIILYNYKLVPWGLGLDPIPIIIKSRFFKITLIYFKIK